MTEPAEVAFAGPHESGRAEHLSMTTADLLGIWVT